MVGLEVADGAIPTCHAESLNEQVIMVDTVDETNSHLSMVVGHEDNVKDIFAIRVQLPKSLVHSLQGLHKGEGRPGAEGLILVLQLVSHVLLDTLLRVDPLFLIHSEQGSGGHRDGDRILRLWRFGFLLGREVVIESLGFLPARYRGGLCPWPGFAGLPGLPWFHAPTRILSGPAGEDSSGDAELSAPG